MPGRGKGGKALAPAKTKKKKAPKKKSGTKRKAAPAKKGKSAAFKRCQKKPKPKLKCGPNGGLYVERRKGNKLVKKYL